MSSSSSARRAPRLVKPVRQNTSSSPQKRRRFRWVRFLVVVMVLVLVGAGGYAVVAFQYLKNSVIIHGQSVENQMLGYTPQQQSQIDWSKFQKYGDGRFNVLVMGIGGVTDTGKVHDGANLTDSIELVSIDTVNKKVSLTSIPRDFYVNVPGHGPSKINAVYADAEQAQADSGGMAAKEMVGKILGVTISNFVVVDFTAAKEAVDTVGGVDIDVPTTIYDPTYPAADEIHYDPFYITAGMHHLDGETALKYMRTRHADNDFGRSKRQQAVLMAVKDKALSLGILTNPVKITQLIGIVGSHVKTDLQVDQIQQFISLYKDIPQSEMSTNVLDTSSALVLLKDKTDPVAGYVEYPIAGMTNYSAIQQWFAKQNPDPLVPKEGATVDVVNGGYGSATQFEGFVTLLQNEGYSVTEVDRPADMAMTRKPQVYAAATAMSSKPVTGQYLGNLMGTSAQVDPSVPAGADYEVVYAPVAGMILPMPTMTPVATPTPVVRGAGVGL